jgi:hypothetical protein
VRIDESTRVQPQAASRELYEKQMFRFKELTQTLHSAGYA